MVWRLKVPCRRDEPEGNLRGFPSQYAPNDWQDRDPSLAEPVLNQPLLRDQPLLEYILLAKTASLCGAYIPNAD